MPCHIKLYGGKDDRFRLIKEEATKLYGYEPTNPEVIGLLLATYDDG